MVKFRVVYVYTNDFDVVGYTMWTTAILSIIMTDFFSSSFTAIKFTEALKNVELHPRLQQSLVSQAWQVFDLLILLKKKKKSQLQNTTKEKGKTE